eukprot:TRINITY_DN36635_c0_g1_i1.p1 TRINITY_DN36635_c0_g1~~TRINITY_DN36635_c0_g1_i1.p1  ORF type:complete len:438 (+),score=125.38 TRINITY_DN36635_c0_g1_i1:109-1422(+)
MAVIDASLPCVTLNADPAAVRRSKKAATLSAAAISAVSISCTELPSMSDARSPLFKKATTGARRPCYTLEELPDLDPMAGDDESDREGEPAPRVMEAPGAQTTPTNRGYAESEAVKTLAAFVAKAAKKEAEKEEEEELPRAARRGRRLSTAPATYSFQQPTSDRLKAAVLSQATLSTAVSSCGTSSIASDTDCEYDETIPSSDSCVDKEASCIIFDWDDTLFPTWYIYEVVRPCISEAEWQEGIDCESPFYDALEEHARYVHETLVAAKNATPNVAIVTLAKQPWVISSGDKFLPGLDIGYLLDELNIPVYYARDHVPKFHVRPQEEGVNMFTIAKRNAMSKVMRRFAKRQRRHVQNMISVGDSPMEMHAVKEIAWGSHHECLCKVVKLIEEPCLSTMGDELKALKIHFEKMVEYREDFDCHMDTVEGLEKFAEVIA